MSGAPSTGARRAAMALCDLLLPRACATCQRALDAGDRGIVCGRCWSRAQELPWPRCGRCGHPDGGRACLWCAMVPPFVRAVRSVCWIPGCTAGAIVHALKYGGWRGVAGEMAARMARLPWPQDVLEERTALVPVPLAPVRERERGYNQSALLARALATRWDIPVWDDCLERRRATRTQTRLTPEERRGNVRGAFAVRAGQGARLGRSHLVLVDDVLTTGATLSECAAALVTAGARTISMVTFGRAPAIGDRT